jgi:hypothetical protein
MIGTPLGKDERWTTIHGIFRIWKGWEKKEVRNWERGEFIDN